MSEQYPEKLASDIPLTKAERMVDLLIQRGFILARMAVYSMLDEAWLNNDVSEKNTNKEQLVLVKE